MPKFVYQRICALHLWVNNIDENILMDATEVAKVNVSDEPISSLWKINKPQKFESSMKVKIILKWIKREYSKGSSFFRKRILLRPTLGFYCADRGRGICGCHRFESKKSWCKTSFTFTFAINLQRGEMSGMGYNCFVNSYRIFDFAFSLFLTLLLFLSNDIGLIAYGSQDVWHLFLPIRKGSKHCKNI